MDINDVRSVITVVSFAVFIGIVVWAYGSKRKARFEEEARSVLDDSDEALGGGKGQGGRK
jgi:cytochrome c oxidase cbb3-type subunit IV